VKLECPIQCGATNEAGVESCAGCGSPLRNHTRLGDYAAQLFNQGLHAARTGELGVARELFAAVVHWIPLDRKARNALALASYELGDHDRARHHWNQVLTQHPGDTFAVTGLRRLDSAGPAGDARPASQD
jgi:outer membrane protein assembly factor BamD (BamD/ComL family)